MSLNNSFMYTHAPNATSPAILFDNNNNNSNSGFEAAPIVYPILFWIFLGIESMLIIAGNGMLCWLFCNRRPLRTQQNYFVMSLSISDLLVGLTIAPCEYCAVLRHTSPSQECSMFCGSVLSFNMLASTFNLVLIAADRFFSIMRPFEYQKVFSKSRARLVVLVAWVITLLLVALPFSWLLIQSMDPMLKFKINLSYGVTLFVLIFVIGLLLGISYFNIVRTIHIKMKQMRAGEGGQRNKTGVKVCILVAVSFFVCWIPTCVSELVILIHKIYLSQAWMNASYFILLLNPCLDPIMYAYYRRDFRCEVSRWCTRRRKSIKKVYDRVFLSAATRERARLNNNFEVKEAMKIVNDRTMLANIDL